MLRKALRLRQVNTLSLVRTYLALKVTRSRHECRSVGGGWRLGEAVFSSLASMWHIEYVFPQWFLIVMMFVAINRELFSALGVAVVLGGIVGRFALAPWGLYELFDCDQCNCVSV